MIRRHCLSLCVLMATVALGCGDPDSKLNADPNVNPNVNPNGGTSCTFDADCADGEACEAQVCVATCIVDADCAAGEVCAPGVNTSQTICQVELNNNPNVVNTNNSTQNNNPMGTLYYSVRIKSTTTGEDACFSEDPGPDIFAVGLEDSTGALLGWGAVDWDEIQFEGNAQTDSSVIDGNAPDLAVDGCPDMFDGNVVSLGCANFPSFIIVSFVDDGFTPIALDATAGQVIRVYEWGGQCGTGTIDDTYDVDICTDTMGARSGDDSSCTIQILVDGSGEAAGDVSGF